MSAWMHAAVAPSADPLALPLGAALLLIFLFSGARLVVRRRRHWLARLGLQALALLLVWRLLCPPALPLVEPGRIDVLGAGWQSALAASPAAELNPADAVRALPEAEVPLPAGVQQVPDLASLLRDQAGARIRLIGEGLQARDLDAARGRLAQWLPAPLPAGLVELRLPLRIAEGAAIDIHGAWQGGPPLRLELQDAAGAVLAAHAFTADSPDDQPRARPFALSLPARAAGELPLELVAIDSEGEPRRLLPLPLRIEPASGLRIGLLAGAPGAELRALRRWAVDAGHELDSRIVLSRGRVMGGPVGFDAEALAALDLLIVDERAWAALGSGGRAQVQEAVESGLGLLLRPLVLPPRTQWPLYAELGFALQAEQAPGEHELADAVRVRALPLRARGDRALPLLSDREGSALGLWHPRGLGRVGLLWLAETQGLLGRGEATAHARLWARLSTQLARARSAPDEALQGQAMAQSGLTLGWTGERAVLCGLAVDASVELDADDPGSARHGAIGLRPDANGCAALWLRAAGLHRIRSSAGEQVLQAIDASALPSLHAAGRARSTRALLAQPLAPSTASDPATGPAWPWLPPLLAVLGLLWWLERRRAA